MSCLANPRVSVRASRPDRLILFLVFFCLLGSGWAAGPPATAATVNTLPLLVKAKVLSLGLGATVKISTVFGRKRYRGYITRIDDNAFEITDRKTLTPNILQYWAVDQVTGRRLPKPANHAGKGGVTSILSMVSRIGFGP